MTDCASLKTAGLYKRLWSEYLERGVAAKANGVPIAWVTAAFPVEIIYAAGLFPYYPENFGACMSAKKLIGIMSAAVESRGYFPDLCAYARCSTGDALSSEHPIGDILKPDLLFCSNAQCGSLQKWFEVASRYYQVPFFLLDTPLIENAPTTWIKRYLVEQLHELLDFLEVYTGKPFNFDRLAEVITLSNEACRLWREILDMAALTPAPFGYFDACFHLAPIVAWRGTKEAVNYYKELKNELNDRLEKKISVVENEQYKLYFDHIPIWPRLRWLSDFFRKKKALVAASHYTHSWAWSFDLDRPLESLVRNYTEVFINRGFEHQVQNIIDMMKQFKINGFVLFSDRSCKPSALGLYDKYHLIKQRTGLPGVVIEADMADERYFFELAIKGRLEEFFDRLGKAI
ncbi:MAG: R-phenyllactate dehydratase subunit alpha precursor [Pelotomaculum sp. PtaB.Bin104]|nr:MAG: R-phenyllactate dehydratase subunit alpha precursor [Pelotomaculum sp. PtaB.Bin104]